MRYPSFQRLLRSNRKFCLRHKFVNMFPEFWLSGAELYIYKVCVRSAGKGVCDLPIKRVQSAGKGVCNLPVNFNLNLLIKREGVR